jgi:hypothetical protein
LQSVTNRKVYCCIFNHLFSPPEKKIVLTERESSIASACNYQLMQKKAVKFLPRFMSLWLSTKSVFFYCNSFTAPLHHLPRKKVSMREKYCKRGLLHKKGIFCMHFQFQLLLSRLAFPIVKWTNSIAQRRIFVCISWMSKWEGITICRRLQSQ